MTHSGFSAPSQLRKRDSQDGHSLACLNEKSTFQFKVMSMVYNCVYKNIDKSRSAYFYHTKIKKLHFIDEDDELLLKLGNLPKVTRLSLSMCPTQYLNIPPLSSYFTFLPLMSTNKICSRHCGSWCVFVCVCVCIHAHTLKGRGQRHQLGIFLFVFYIIFETGSLSLNLGLPILARPVGRALKSLCLCLPQCQSYRHVLAHWTSVWVLGSELRR